MLVSRAGKSRVPEVLPRALHFASHSTPSIFGGGAAGAKLHAFRLDLETEPCVLEQELPPELWNGVPKLKARQFVAADRPFMTNQSLLRRSASAAAWLSSSALR